MGSAWRKAEGADLRLRLLLLLVELLLLLQTGDAKGLLLPPTQTLQSGGSCERTRAEGRRAGTTCLTMRIGRVRSRQLTACLLLRL